MLLLALSGTATRTDEPVLAQSDVEEALTPTWDSEIVFPEASLTSHAAGGTTVFHRNELDAGESIHYEFFVNVPELTYKALYFDVQDDPSPDSTQSTDSWSTLGRANPYPTVPR